MRDFALEVFFTRWQQATRFHLTASECETLALQDVLALADETDARRWQTLQLDYTDPRGALWLRESIAATYETAEAAQILCFTGAQEGIHCAMHALLTPADHAIVVVPNYQSAETIPLGLCEISGVSLDPARGWALDIEKLAAAVRPNTKLISINFPNNPTGKVIDRETFDALVALCRKHGIWLFSDEIYRLIDRDPAKRLPQAFDCYERGISLSGLSKCYGLPGVRIGWLACRDAAVLTRMERVKHYLSICNAGPNEVLANIALKASAQILGRNRVMAEANLDLLRGFMADHAHILDWHEPDGGVTAYPRYRVETLTDRAIREAGVLLLPASVFRSDLARAPADRFRIGFGRADTGAALEALAAFLDRAATPAARRRTAEIRPAHF